MVSKRSRSTRKASELRKPKDARAELRLDAELKAEMDAAAAEQDMTFSQFVRWLFLNWKKSKKPT